MDPHHHDDPRRATATDGLIGFGVALVWLAIVSGVSYWLANLH